MRRSARAAAIAGVVFAAWPVWLMAGWADRDAKITAAEFLAFEFRTHLARGETRALNDFSLVTFYPSNSEERAFVLITQTWHDERVSATDLRREMRAVSEAVFQHFQALCQNPAIRKRWPKCSVEAALVIKHVRYSDLHEVLGVTVGPKTEFGPEAIARVASDVNERGGIWD